MTTVSGAPPEHEGVAVSHRVPQARQVRIGLGAGLLGAAFLVVHLAAIAETAAAPTTAPGIRSSTWTPFTGIATIVSGDGALHGSFRPGYILLGLALLVAMSLVAGVIGTWWIYVCLGTAGPPWLGGLLGVAYGVFVEVVAFQFVINPIQSPDVVYRSVPPWAWWAGFGVYGGIVGLAAASRLERAA